MASGTKLKITAGKGEQSVLGASASSRSKSEPNPLTPKKKDYSKKKKGGADNADFGYGNFGMTGMSGES